MWSLLSRTLPRRAAGWLLAGAALAACAVASCAGSIDLAVYLRAASELADGGDPNLTPDGQLPWLYPPFAAAVYLPLVVAPFPVSAILVALGSVTALFRTLRLVLRRLLPARPDLAPVLLALALATEPVAFTLGYGQLNLVLAWLVTEGFLGRRRWLIGIAAGLKLTPLMFLLPLLVRRDLRGIVQVLIGFAATIAAGWLIAPAASTDYWTGLFLAAPDRIGIAYATNQSLTGAVARAFGPGGSPLLTTALSLIVLLAAVTVLRRTPDQVLALSVTGLAGLLISPISWIHHWTWVLPLLLWCAVHAHRGLAWSWSLVLMGHLTWWYPTEGTVEYSHDLIGKLVQDSWTLLALITLGVLTHPRTAPLGLSALAATGQESPHGLARHRHVDHRQQFRHRRDACGLE